MSKPTVKYHPMPEGVDWIVSSTITHHSASKVVSVDAAHGVRLVFAGKELDVVNGVIADGIIKGLMIHDSNHRPLIEFRNLSIDASKFNAANMDQALFATWLFTVIDGANFVGTKNADMLEGYGSANDRLRGLGGADTLRGHAGNDHLYGGIGCDVFVFEINYGKDRIMDFDPSGGLGQQDLIDADAAGILNKYRDGRNTVLDFGDGDKLTLVNIKPSEISSEDFLV